MTKVQEENRARKARRLKLKRLNRKARRQWRRFQAAREALSGEHEDEYVAFLDGEVVDSGNDISELLERVLKNFSEKPFVIGRLRDRPAFVGGPRGWELRRK